MAQSKAVPAAQATLISNAYDAFKPFRKLRETMPLQYVTAFMQVAMDEHQNVSTYATRVGTSQSLMSRHMADLGAVNRYHTEGLGLVELYDDLLDRRNKRVRLTALGKHVVYEMCEALKRS